MGRRHRSAEARAKRRKYSTTTFAATSGSTYFSNFMSFFYGNIESAQYPNADLTQHYSGMPNPGDVVLNWLRPVPDEVLSPDATTTRAMISDESASQQTESAETAQTQVKVAQLAAESKQLKAEVKNLHAELKEARSIIETMVANLDVDRLRLLLVPSASKPPVSPSATARSGLQDILHGKAQQEDGPPAQVLDHSVHCHAKHYDSVKHGKTAEPPDDILEVKVANEADVPRLQLLRKERQHYGRDAQLCMLCPKIVYPKEAFDECCEFCHYEVKPVLEPELVKRKRDELHALIAADM